MDKEDYENRMKGKLENIPYRKLRVDFLPQLVKRMDRVVKECQPLWRVKVSKSVVPRINHPQDQKTNKEMREIVSMEMPLTHMGFQVIALDHCPKYS